jgi:hypothetical protein
MTRIISTPVWKNINPLLNSKVLNKICIAYVTSSTLSLKKGDILVCDASISAIKSGMTSAAALQHYSKKGVKIYSNDSLHSKFLVTDKFIVVGSANLSENSYKYLLETAIITYESQAISQAAALFHQILDDYRTVIIDGNRLEELTGIKVEKNAWNGTKRNPLKISLGETCWFLRCFPLSERISDRLEQKNEEVRGKINSNSNINYGTINLLRWKADSQFGRQVRIGDLIIMRFGEKGTERSSVYPPSTVLAIEPDGDHVLIYHDGTRNDRDKTAYGKFKKDLKSLGIKSGFSGRIMKVKNEELNKIKSIW